MEGYLDPTAMTSDVLFCAATLVIGDPRGQRQIKMDNTIMRPA